MNKIFNVLRFVADVLPFVVQLLQSEKERKREKDRDTSPERDKEKNKQEDTPKDSVSSGNSARID